MTRGQKTVSALALLLLLFFGGGAGGEPVDPRQKPPKPDEPCPTGQHWIFDEAAWAWVCAPSGVCPPGQVWIEAFGTCVDEGLACPAGQHWDPAAQKCVADKPPPPDCGPGKHPVWFGIIPGAGLVGWQCVDDEPPDEPDKPGEIKDVPAEPKDTPGVVEDDPADYIKPYPTGGSFYQVVQGDHAYGGANNPGIVYKYLRTEAFLSARDFGGLDDAGANDYAKTFAAINANRVKAWTQIIGCSGANDLAYATWGYDPANDPDPAYTGRVIRLVAQHPNNLQRLLNGQGLARCIKLGTQANKGNASGVRVDDACHSYELLWLPQLNRQALWESGALKTEDGETWSDGTSKGLPPPFISDRDFFYFDGALPEPVPKFWGCFALALELP